MKALEDVVLVKFDAEKGEGLELAKAFNVTGYPTFIFATGEAVTMERWSGYEKSFFLETMEVAVADPTTIEQKQERFHESPTASDAERLARYHGSMDEYGETVALYRKAAELNPEDDYAWQILQNTAYGVEPGVFTSADTKKAADALFASAHAKPEEYIHSVGLLKYVGRKNEIEGLATPYIEPALAKTANVSDEKLAARRVGLEIDHALLIAKDKDKAYLLKLGTMEEGWKDDPSQLNAMAWWCFENTVQLEEAEALARRGIELASPGPERANIYDTAAEICNARGNCDDAVELIQLAIADDPNREFFKEQLARFEEIRAAQTN